MPTNDIVALTDDKGILLLGDPTQIDNSLQEQGVVARAVTPRNAAVAGAVVQGVGQFLAESGRYLKLTPESAAAVKSLGGFSANAVGDVAGVLRAENGQILKHLAFQAPGKAALGTPAAPIAVGAMMTQLAIEQAISDVTSYLEEIDAKIDKLLEHQQDLDWARLNGVALLIQDAMSMRDKRGALPETTWDQIQGTAQTLATCQALALKKLDRLSRDVQSASKLGDVEDATKKVRDEVQMWLNTLAATANLQDKVAVLELDRVAQRTPEELEAHERALRETRNERLERLDNAIEVIAAQMRDAAAAANGKKVLRPRIVAHIHENHEEARQHALAFAKALGLDVSESEALESVTWTKAVATLLEERASQARNAAVEAASKARDVKDGAVDKVRETGDEITARREKRILRKAAEIMEKDLQSDE